MSTSRLTYLSLKGSLTIKPFKNHCFKSYHTKIKFLKTLLFCIKLILSLLVWPQDYLEYLYVASNKRTNQPSVLKLLNLPLLSECIKKRLHAALKLSSRLNTISAAEEAIRLMGQSPWITLMHKACELIYCSWRHKGAMYVLCIWFITEEQEVRVKQKETAKVSFFVCLFSFHIIHTTLSWSESQWI